MIDLLNYSDIEVILENLINEKLKNDDTIFYDEFTIINNLFATKVIANLSDYSEVYCMYMSLSISRLKELYRHVVDLEEFIKKHFKDEVPVYGSLELEVFYDSSFKTPTYAKFSKSNNVITLGWDWMFSEKKFLDEHGNIISFFENANIKERKRVFYEKIYNEYKSENYEMEDFDV